MEGISYKNSDGTYMTTKAGFGNGRIMEGFMDGFGSGGRGLSSLLSSSLSSSSSSLSSASSLSSLSSSSLSYALSNWEMALFSYRAQGKGRNEIKGNGEALKDKGLRGEGMIGDNRKGMRKAMKKGMERKETEGKEMERREKERKEMERKETERKEMERIVMDRKKERKELKKKEMVRNELEMKEEEIEEMEALVTITIRYCKGTVGYNEDKIRKVREMIEVERREVERLRMVEMEMERKEMERKKMEREEIERKEVERKEMERKEMERDRKEIERKETDRKETERKKSKRKEIERKEMDRKEMEREKMERKVKERKEKERKELERKKTERKEMERKESMRKEMEKKVTEEKKMGRKDEEKGIGREENLEVLRNRNIKLVAKLREAKEEIARCHEQMRKKNYEMSSSPRMRRIGKGKETLTSVTFADVDDPVDLPTREEFPPLPPRGGMQDGSKRKAGPHIAKDVRAVPPAKETRNKSVVTPAMSEVEVGWSVVARRSRRRGEAEDDPSPLLPPRLLRKRELILKGLDVSVGTCDIMEALCSIGGYPEKDIRMGPIRTRNNGPGIVWVQLPMDAALKVARKGRILLGRIVARVELLKVRPLQCFKCWLFGHTQDACRSMENRWGACYRCGQKGHIARECVNLLHCVVCSDAGMKAHHRLGGPLCMAQERHRELVAGGAG